MSVARAVPGTFSNLASAIVSLTSIFIPADETITLSLPSLTVNHGEAFTISWEHAQRSTDGAYTFRYDCAPGVSFATPLQNGSEVPFECDTPLNLIGNVAMLQVIAYSEDNRFIDVTVHVDFTAEGASQPTVTGSTLLTIANPELSSSPDATSGGNGDQSQGTGSTGGQTTTPPATTGGGGSTTRTPGVETTQEFPVINTGQTASDPNGRVDLEASIIEIGIVDKNTGEFTASTTPYIASTQYRAAVRFAVENVGTKTSDQWNFNAVLPTFPAHIFTSPNQVAMGTW